MKADNNQGDLFKQPISPAPLPCRKERRPRRSVGRGAQAPWPQDLPNCLLRRPERRGRRSLHGDSGQTKSTSLRGGRSPTWQSRRFSNISFSRNGILLFAGLPRQCAHWLAMTCIFSDLSSIQKAHNRFRLWAYALQFYLTAYRAALAFSTRAAKAAESWIAISDRLLRFISMPAFLTPFMNLE